MEYFKPPNFADSSADEASSAEILQSFSDTDDSSQQAERYVSNILEEKSKSSRKRVDYSDFNSAEFNEVDTLLTNVEEYSKRIREDVDKYARNVRNETDLFRSEIELELANALIKRIESEKKAAEIIKEAEDNRERVLKEGHDEGFEAGFAEGIKQQKEENEKNTGATLALMEELKDLRKKMTQEYEHQIVQLSLLIAERVVYKNLRKDKNLVLDMLKKSMQRIEGKGSVRITVHPVELDFMLANQEDLRSFLDENQTISIRADQNISPSGPVIETDFSVIDLSLTKQFKEIEKRLRECVDDRKALFT